MSEIKMAKVENNLIHTKNLIHEYDALTRRVDVLERNSSREDYISLHRRQKERSFNELARLVKIGLDNNWISVDDRLPKNHERVLVYTRTNKIICLTRLDTKSKFYDYLWNRDYGSGQVFNPDYVTHWMPIPEPPQTQTLSALRGIQMEEG